MESKKRTFPLVPIRNVVVFPSTSVFLMIGREKSVAALKASQREGGQIVVTAQKTDTGHHEDIDEKNFYQVGTLCQIRTVSGSENAGYQVLVSGLCRFQIIATKHHENYLLASGVESFDDIDNSVETEALFNSLKSVTKEIMALLPTTDLSLQNLIDQIQKKDEVAFLGASYLKLDLRQMQKLLEETNIKKKMEMLIALLNREKEVLLLEKDIKEKVTKRLTMAQRDSLLREHLNMIKEELGEGEDSSRGSLLGKIKEAQMPDAVETLAIKELKRLETLHPAASDYHVIHNYIDWLCQMPWNKATQDFIDLQKSEEILERNHYGLRKIKKRILEHLAANQLKGALRGPILCLIGPPGVGKTSLGKSVADALGRKFISTSLGGIKDEAEIRGHRRTYVGALPGRIIDSIKRAGVNNPLILLDEIDKLGAGSIFHGDPSSAMLEVLDPDQNNAFVDHYLDVPFDLSRVFFMATANRLDTIPSSLLDRMELVEISSYTLTEKTHIGTDFIIPKTLHEYALDQEKVIFEEGLLLPLIEYYTREAGVRELQRLVASLCRGAAYDIVKRATKPLVIDLQKMEDYLGPSKFHETPTMRKWVPGLALGLAWMPTGGNILHLECIKMPGTGKLKLTGQLGEVMRESAELALSFVKSCIKTLNPDFNFDAHDIHLHVPAGAIPKDGPSAGITMFAALASLISDKSIPQEFAMTGELTLSGSVLPVGGIKEKVIAAHRYKIKKLILPSQNEKELFEIPEEIKKDLEFFPVESINQVLELTLQITL